MSKDKQADYEFHQNYERPGQGEEPGRVQHLRIDA